MVVECISLSRKLISPDLGDCNIECFNVMRSRLRLLKSLVGIVLEVEVAFDS